MDFCNEDTAWLVGYKEQMLDPGDYIFVRRGQVWADPDVTDAAAKLRAVWSDPEARRRKAEAAYAHVRANFSVEAIARRYGARLRELLGSR
jgi:glycosyltransferase involved in cell wall biosynthesis